MIKPAQFSKIAMAALVGSAVIFSHTQPADAAWFRKDTYLGLASTGDNCNYWKAQGKQCLPSPPNDRNKLCQWKYPNVSNVWGQSVWFSFDTKCYSWRWFWQ